MQSRVEEQAQDLIADVLFLAAGSGVERPQLSVKDLYHYSDFLRESQAWKLLCNIAPSNPCEQFRLIVLHHPLLEVLELLLDEVQLRGGFLFECKVLGVFPQNPIA